MCWKTEMCRKLPYQAINLYPPFAIGCLGRTFVVCVAMCVRVWCYSTCLSSFLLPIQTSVSLRFYWPVTMVWWHVRVGCECHMSDCFVAVNAVDACQSVHPTVKVTCKKWLCHFGDGLTLNLHICSTKIFSICVRPFHIRCLHLQCFAETPELGNLFCLWWWGELFWFYTTSEFCSDYYI